MKSKGFTLVELLAVLVLISAIALIAVPSILNYINESKDEISDVTEKIIISGAELYVEANKKDFSVPQKQYCVTLQEIVDQKHLSDPILDSVSGNEIDLDTFVKVDHYYDLEKKRYDYRYKVSSECVEQEYLCAAVTKDSVSVGNIPNGDYNVGDEYVCQVSNNEFYRFFVLKREDDSIKLLMDQNLGATVAWITHDHFLEVGGDQADWDNWRNMDVYGPVTANASLADRTSGWTKLTQSQITLPNAQDIADAIEDTEWAYNNYTGTVGPMWLWKNLNKDNGPLGYWTSTIYPSDGYAWFMRYSGYLYCDGVGSSRYIGVRPVITIDTSKIKN